MEKHHVKKSELISSAAHEIKNSLNPIINLSSILMRDTAGRLTQEESSYLEIIERNGRKILALVEELSSLNKLSGREQKDSGSSAAVGEVIDDAGQSVSTSTTPALEESSRSTVHEFVLLVIDDDMDSMIPVKAILEHEFKGMAIVYHAESGGKGLDLLEKIKPDIILLDLTLPDISGLSLVKNIKHLFVEKNIPVIAFSGMDIAGNRDKMKRSGFDDVIQKPFNIETFTKTIRKWIDR